MEPTTPHCEPPDDGDRPAARMECIGSFKAYTPRGEPQVIEIWTHFSPVHDRERHRVRPSELVLRTRDGRPVERIDQGEYRFQDAPQIILSTNDPQAP